jgi:hypothetical protein
VAVHTKLLMPFSFCLFDFYLRSWIFTSLKLLRVLFTCFLLSVTSLCFKPILRQICVNYKLYGLCIQPILCGSSETNATSQKLQTKIALRRYRTLRFQICCIYFVYRGLYSIKTWDICAYSNCFSFTDEWDWTLEAKVATRCRRSSPLERWAALLT